MYSSIFIPRMLTSLAVIVRKIYKIKLLQYQDFVNIMQIKVLFLVHFVVYFLKMEKLIFFLE